MTEPQKAAELIRLTRVYADGCGNTQNLKNVGDLTRASVITGINIWTGDPTECEECTVDYLRRVANVMAGRAHDADA